MQDPSAKGQKIKASKGYFRVYTKSTRLYKVSE